MPCLSILKINLILIPPIKCLFLSMITFIKFLIFFKWNFITVWLFWIKSISKSPLYSNDTDFSVEKFPKAGNNFAFFDKFLVQFIAIPLNPSSHKGYSFVGSAFLIDIKVSQIYP